MNYFSIPKNISRNPNESTVTGEMEDQFFRYGVAQKLNPNQFKKEHYDFVSWIGNDGNTYENKKEMSSYRGDDLELSAQWAPSKYYVRFNGIGETSGTMDDQEFTYGVPQRLNPNQFEKKNHTFIGWTDDNGREISDRQEIELSSDINLDANWSRITATMTFYKEIESNSPQSAPPPEEMETTEDADVEVPSQITIIYL